MDKRELVEEIRHSLDKFILEKCKVNMAMLIKDIDSDTFTFLISSRFMDLLNYYDALKFVAEFFYNDLSSDAFSIISRINIVSTNDPSIKLIYRAMHASRSIVTIKNCNFFGVNIDDAIILESHED